VYGNDDSQRRRKVATQVPSNNYRKNASLGHTVLLSRVNYENETIPIKDPLKSLLDATPFNFNHNFNEHPLHVPPWKRHQRWDSYCGNACTHETQPGTQETWYEGAFGS
jgi:hypothetical protein